MTTITQLNGFAQTALAAYAHDLAVGNESNALNYKADGVGMADAQARAFDSEWAVLQQSPSNPITGFSAVLLQSRTTGEKVLAIAGTDPASPADIITDLVNVAYYGTVLGMPQYGSLESFYSQLVSAGLLGATEQITVTGHSLGGFLAQAFTARHTGVVAAAYTYNAPGFGTFELLLGFLGVTDTTGAASKITNVHATDGLSVTAGLGYMLGTTQPVRIEGDANPLNNHSVRTLGDALKIYETCARLQPGITIEKASTLFAASGLGSRRLEDALDTLRTVFNGSASNDTNKTPTGDREAFYNNLAQLQNDAGFQALSGQVQLVPTHAGFASAAQASTNTALAYRYALLELLPVAVVAGTDAQNQTLYGAYTQRLSLYDASTGQGELTQSWMQDRSSLLQSLLTANTQDAATNPDGYLAVQGAPGGSVNTRFIDLASGVMVQVNHAQISPSTAPNQYIIFGDAGANTLNGSAQDDHLYGGAGADTLDGQDDADYLEGNAGDDRLDGGTGADTLQGGSGADTYSFGAAWGKDLIADSDGLGRIRLDGIELQGRFTGTGHGYALDLGAGQYAGLAVVRDSASTTGYKAVIVRGTDTANTITIRDFDLARAQGSDGYLGIRLDGAPRLALQGEAVANPFADLGFSPDSLAGQASTLAEGTGKTFTVFLSLPAHAGDTLTDGLPGTSISIAACGRLVRFAGLFGFKFGAFEDQKRHQRWRRGRADAQVGRRPFLRPFMHAMRVTRSSGARVPHYQPAVLR